jgi:hypothetical protein
MLLFRRLRLRHIVAPPALEEVIKYCQFHLHRGKVPLAAMHLRRVVGLSSAWRRKRIFLPLLQMPPAFAAQSLGVA